MQTWRKPAASVSRRPSDQRRRPADPRPLQSACSWRFCWTAQRKSAVLDLRWQQVNFERRQIQFNPEGREQTRKRRPVLPMSNTLERVLLPHVGEPDQLVCGFKRDPYEKFKQWAYDMGMPELTAHVFRHT